MPTGKLDRHKLKALFDARLSRHDKEHKEHEAALKKMFDKHAKVRQEMHERHQAERRKMHAEHLESLGSAGNPLHTHPRSK